MSNGIEQREQWGSRMGFILRRRDPPWAGQHLEIPYMVGANGGGAFVVIYLAIVFTIGVSVMLAEFAIGRNAGLNAGGSFKKIPGGAWPRVGGMGVIAGFLILSFYGVVAGWTLAYMVKSFTGLIAIAAEGKAGDAFGAFVSNPTQVILWQAIFMLMTIWIVYKGIGSGIEQYCKWMMPGLFLILLILIVRSVTLEGAGKGLEFYLKPDFSKVHGGVFLAALGQGFFSLSLGMGCMITYGSYLSKKEVLPSAAVTVSFLDTCVAFLAGLVIFPAVFAFGVEPERDRVSPHHPSQRVRQVARWHDLVGALLLPALPRGHHLRYLAPRVCVAYFKDELGWSRPKATWILGLVIFLLGVPSALSLGGHIPQVAGKDFLDAVDFVSSNVLLPLGGIFISLFVGWVWLDGAEKEITNNGTIPFGFMTAWVCICRIVAPVAIAYIFFSGLKW
jgi:NSS family neurotransmitter:Na+ symporter